MGPEIQEQASIKVSIRVSRLWATHSIAFIPHGAINAKRVGEVVLQPFGHSEFSADRALIIVQLQHRRGIMRLTE